VRHGEGITTGRMEVRDAHGQLGEAWRDRVRLGIAGLGEGTTTRAGRGLARRGEGSTTGRVEHFSVRVRDAHAGQGLARPGLVGQGEAWLGPAG
jgi:hypothetical protein